MFIPTYEYCVNGSRTACVPGIFEAIGYSVAPALYHRSTAWLWTLVTIVFSSGIVSKSTSRSFGAPRQ